MPFVNLCEKSVSRNKMEKVLFCWSLRHSSSFSAQVCCTLWLTSPHTVSSCHLLIAVYCFLWLAGEWKTGILFPVGGHHGVHTGSGNDRDSHPRSTGEFFLKDTAPLHSVEYQVKNAWSFTSTSAYAYMEQRLRVTSLRDFRLLQWCSWDLRSSEILGSVDW